MKSTLIEVIPNLFVAGVGRDDIPDDWRADGVEPVDLRSLWEGMDEHNLLHFRDGELFRIAAALAGHVREGKRLAIVDERNRIRAPLVAALTLVALSHDAPSTARDLVRRAVGPDALSSPTMQRWFLKLKRHDVLNPPQAPKKIFFETIRDSKTGDIREVKV